MKKISLLILIFLTSNFAYATGESVNDWPYIKVRWHCDTTYEVDASDEVDIGLSVNLKKGEFNSPDFMNMLKTIDRENPVYDFYKCVERFSGNFSNSLYQLADEQGVSKIYKENMINIENKFFQIIAKYGKAIFDRGTITPFSPNSYSKMYLDNNKEWEKIYRAVVKNFSDDSCERVFSAENEFFIDRAFLERLSDLKNKILPSCQNRLLSYIAKSLLISKMPRETCVKNKNLCESREKSIKSAIDFIEKAGFDVSEVRSDLANYYISNAFVYSDKKMKIETERIIKSDITGIYANYILTKIENKVLNQDYLNIQKKIVKKGTSVDAYLIEIDLSFKKSNEINVSENFNKEYSKKVASCLASVKDKMRGENGEFLEIKLLSDRINYVKNRKIHNNVIDVNFDNDFIRSNSDEWRYDLDCPSIVHEILHSLGLPDEYKEENSGIKINKNILEKVKFEASYPDRNCRAIGPENSIMSDQNLAFLRDDSIFYPAQFRVLTKPESSENKIYYACSRNSMSTSRSSFGSGCEPTTPKECYGDVWMY